MPTLVDFAGDESSVIQALKEANLNFPLPLAKILTGKGFT